MSCRRLWVLVNGLPPEAATWRVNGQQWTLLEELLALAVERVDHWGLAQAHIHTNGKGLPTKSLQIPRPGEQPDGPDASKDRVVTDAAEIKAFFGAI